eukprot:c24840_g1_i1 orf=472-2889(+)
MECLQIDWKNIDATYEKDEFYESIQAPKWIDFTVPLQPVDDHAWFCGKVGCTHEKKKIVVRALNQESKASLEASKASANMVAPVAVKTASAGFGGKKTRGVVSSSLSSLSDITAAYAKSKALHHIQMPSIGETKGDAMRNARRQQASENENPNRAGKFQGAGKKPILGALEGIAKNAKMSESKGNAGKEASPHGEEPTRMLKKASSTLAEQVNISQTGPVLEATKSTFIFGKRHPMHAKSTLTRVSSSDFCSISEAKIKKAGGKHLFSRPLPTARDPHLTASVAMPIIRRSAANVRPLHGVHLGNDKVATCKPPRVTKDVRVNVHAHACRKKTDHKEELLMIKGVIQQRDPQKDNEMQMTNTATSPKKQELCLQLLVKNDELELDSKENDVLALTASRKEQHTQREVKEEECIRGVEPSVPPMMQEQEKHLVEVICVEDKQLLHSLQGGEEEGKANTIQTREKEDSVTNTLEKFLENLQLTSNEDESVSDVEHSASKQDMAQANQVDCAAEHDIVQSHHVDNAPEHEMMIFHYKDCAMEHNTVQAHHVDCSTEYNKEQSHHEDTALEQETVPSMSCSPHNDELSHMCKPLSSQDGRIAMLVSSDDAACINDKTSSTSCQEQLKKTKQKENRKIMKDWQRHRARKRKSSELNFKVNCSSRDHNHETPMVPSTGGLVSQQFKESSSTAKSPTIAPATQPHSFKEPCEEHHKRMKATIVQAFKPFRLRTEERGALKELGLGKKELIEPNSKETVHHALRMPCFGHPFRPQRSTKKLTIPREPKFHASKIRKARTSPVTPDIASSLGLC